MPDETAAADNRGRAATSHATLTIDHDAIAHNMRVLREHAHCDVLAVVKADGFGLGAVAVAKTALAAGATSLGVATIDEALALRRAGIDAVILAWLGHPDADVAAAVDERIEIGVGSRRMLDAVLHAAADSGVQAVVQLEVDTGMNRGGAGAAEWPALCEAAARSAVAGSIRVQGVWSHLANPAGLEPAAVSRQVEAFRQAVSVARQHGLAPEQLHLASSGAALMHPSTRFDLVRCGAAVYGIEPSPERDFGLRPVVRLAARILQLRRVPAGAAVSYGGCYVTQQETTLALIPLGYADGVPHALADCGFVSVHGVMCPIAGAVSMDQVVADVGNAELEAGDEAVLIGDPALGEPGLADVAAWAGTVPQEILTNLGTRMERRHIGAAYVE